MPSLFILSLILFQEVPDGTVFETMKVDYIFLDVLATTRNGAPVRDLTKEDFLISENGKTVPLDVFDTIAFNQSFEAEHEPDQVVGTSRMPSLRVSLKEQEPPFHQTIIMLLDFGYADLRTFRLTMAQLKDFYGQLKGRDDLQIYIVSVTSGSVTQGFTTNPELVLMDLEAFEDKYKAQTGKNLMVSRQTSLVELERELDSCLDHLIVEGGGTAEGFIGSGAAANIDGNMVRSYFHCLQLYHNNFVENHVNRTLNNIRIMEKFVIAFKDIPGLKSMFLVSPGFSLNPGQASSELTSTYANLNHPDIPKPQFRSNSLVSHFQKMAHAAISNRVTFHTFGLNTAYAQQRAGPEFGNLGLAANTTAAYNIYSEEVTEGLSHLAEVTGGTFSRGTNLATQIQKAVDVSQFFYVLGYAKPEGNPKRYRTIKVSCKRKGVVLSHRAGYFPDPQKAPRRLRKGKH